MDQFARTVLGFHGCTKDYAIELLSGERPILEWEPSGNPWDWLGHGIYFWEHSPERALRWAQERCARKGGEPAVLGAVIQLGKCFDLLNEGITELLAKQFKELQRFVKRKKKSLPKNTGKDWKLRELDCMVLNYALEKLEAKGTVYETVRGAFAEGEPVYPGAGFSREAHIQIAVRDRSNIIGVFLPNEESWNTNLMSRPTSSPKKPEKS